MKDLKKTLERFTCEELKQELRDRGLCTSGNKELLIFRLYKYFKKSSNDRDLFDSKIRERKRINIREEMQLDIMKRENKSLRQQINNMICEKELLKKKFDKIKRENKSLQEKYDIMEAKNESLQEKMRNYRGWPEDTDIPYNIHSKIF
nr:PREDICTED: uncharacterized protein LOC105676886 [Linepithema humile]XP_012230524.1 PREDICTED: uncharacterized protein LOC105676886 [Linepithema humile]